MKYSFYCYDSDKNDLEKFLNCGQQILEEFKNKILELQKKADENTGKIMPVQSLLNYFSTKSIMSYHEGSGWYFKPNYKIAAKNALEETELKYKTGKEIHEKNLIAIENNKQVIEKIKLFMSNIGIPNSHYEKDTKSRARYPKDLEVRSGFLNDITRHISTDDGYKYFEDSYKRQIERIAAFEKEEEKKEQDIIRATESKEKEQKNRTLQSVLIIKYGLDYESSWESIRDEILSRDKYLRLGYYLEKNRGDWNDGCDYAETGLENFKIECDEDQKIYNEINDLCVNFGENPDGRCFRDCEYNYSYLYSKANAELYNDLQKIKEVKDL